MSITILSAEYITSKNDAIDVMLDIDGLEVPYTYSVNGANDGKISSFIKSELAKNDVTIKPYSGPSDTDILTDSIRRKRNHLLSATDFFMTVQDYPIADAQKNEIKEYRQRLRDITKQHGFPNNVVWPDIPDCIKDKVSQ